jgi:NitT/TauT family transport system substrate-binding protein
VKPLRTATRTLADLRRCSLVLVLGFLLAACGDGASGSGAGEAPAPGEEPSAQLTPVTIQFGWIADAGGGYPPAVLALENGYFEEEGLDATLNEGGGSVTPPLLLGSGKADIVLATVDDVPLGVAEGLNLVSVAVIEQKTPSAIIYRADSGISEPADLAGKTVAVSAYDSASVLLNAFLEKVGVDPDSVTTENVDIAARTSIFIAGKVDAFTGFPRNEAVRLEKGEGIKIGTFPYADEGISFLSLGVYTTQEIIDTNPEMVRGAVRALLRGYVAAADDGMAAVEAAKKHFPQHYDGIDMELGAAQAQQIGQTAVDQAPADGLGSQSEADWAASVDLLVKYFGLEDPQPATAYFTNEFVPEDLD